MSIIIRSILIAITAALLSAAHADATGPDMTIVRIDGDVQVKTSHKKPWQPAKAWMNLSPGATIRTSSGASIDLLMEETALIRLKEHTEITPENIKKNQIKALHKAMPELGKSDCGSGIVIKVTKGKALFYVSPAFSSLPLIIETPYGAATVMGTRFGVEVKNGKGAELAVFQGELIAWNRGRAAKPVIIEEGFTAILGRRTLKPSPMNRVCEQRFAECTSLHLGLNGNQALSTVSGKYRGAFSRGYAPSASFGADSYAVSPSSTFVRPSLQTTNPSSGLQTSSPTPTMSSGTMTRTLSGTFTGAVSSGPSSSMSPSPLRSGSFKTGGSIRP